MKIGLVTPAWPSNRNANGITTSISFLVDGLEALGHEVAILPMIPMHESDPRCFGPEPYRPLKLKERILNKLGISDPMPQLIGEQIAAAARKAINARDIEVLVMEESYGWAGTVQDMLPIPVIVTLHGPWYIQTALQNEPVSKAARWREAGEAEAFRKCAGVTAPSRHVLDRTRAHIRDMTPLQAVIHNPIHLKEQVFQHQLDPKQRKSILFVGRHDHRKGADVLLQGFADLIAGGGDAYLTFVGPDHGVVQSDGSSRSFPEALSKLAPTVQERINFVGHSTTEEIDALRKQHFISVITSRYETFGYVVLEAMAAGSAVISTAAGGPTEIIKDGETGLLIPVDDPSALTGAFRRLLDDPEFAASLGEAARQDVAARFSPNEVAEQLVQFSKQVIDQHNP